MLWERELFPNGKLHYLIQRDHYPQICLVLAIINGDATEADKNHIVSALNAIGVRVYFCGY